MTQKMLTNPALAELSFQLGNRDMNLSDASFLPRKDDAVHGQVEVRSIEQGTLLAQRKGVDPPNPPAATWVIGRDESRDHYTVLYADGRRISRVYQMTLSNGTWSIGRTTPSYHNALR